jgi:DNA-binding transcriptional LysR family regulator
METRHLAALVAIVDEGSFTRAAARCGVSQPGISALIRRLEATVGEPLFDRSGRAATLTAAGEALLPHARAALAAIEAGRGAVAAVSGLVTGRVTVGMVTACGFGGLFDVLERFHREHPGVELTLSEANSDELLAGLRAGTLDVALAAVAGPDALAGLASIVAVDDGFAAVVPGGDPLRADDRGSVPVAALRGRGLIALPPGTGLRASLEGACERAGFVPRVTLEASNPDVLVRLAARGLGVAILPETAEGELPEGVRMVRLREPAPRGRLVLAWRADPPPSPATRELVRLGRELLGGG